MTRVVAALVFCLVAVPVYSQSLFAEGEHYERLAQPQPSTEEGVQVLEFFSYGCSHCFEFEESLEPWVAALPENVHFRRIPAGLGRRQFQMLAVVFHIANHFDVSAKTHPVLFDQIHVKKNNAMGSMDGLASVFDEHAGISNEQFTAALNSPEVLQSFQQTEVMQAPYELRGVPMLVVNGKFKISRNQYVTSYSMMLEVADYLISRESSN